MLLDVACSRWVHASLAPGFAASELVVDGAARWCSAGGHATTNLQLSAALWAERRLRPGLRRVIFLRMSLLSMRNINF
jgi:hypothetical protein